LREVYGNFEKMGHRLARANSDTTTASGVLLMMVLKASGLKIALVPHPTNMNLGRKK
jgi:hypothetical protein